MAICQNIWKKFKIQLSLNFSMPINIFYLIMHKFINSLIYQQVQILCHVIIINILIYIQKEKMIKHRDGVMAGSEKNMVHLLFITSLLLITFKYFLSLILNKSIDVQHWFHFRIASSLLWWHCLWNDIRWISK